jgi:D-glycero-D-manno-heptose 1,7-bisphosphate phosphatase
VKLERAVFLDRDGVLIADVKHLTSAAQIHILPGVPDALARLRAAGWRLIIATNQSVVARGQITEPQLKDIHRDLLDQLRAEGAEIDDVYYCPHHPEGAVAEYRWACDCRKPNPGMLLRAAAQWHLDLAASVIVGDAESDIEAGRRAGCKTILITEMTPRPAGTEQANPNYGADVAARDLSDAAEWILTRSGTPS